MGGKGMEDVSIKYMLGSIGGREREGRDFKWIYVLFKRGGEDLKTKLLFYSSNLKTISWFLNYSLHKKLNMKTQ